MTAQGVALIVVTAAALILSGIRFARRFRPLLSAGGAPRRDRPGERLLGVFAAVGLHRRLLQRPLSGIIHAMIFASFFVLMTAVIQAFAGSWLPVFRMEGIGGQTWIAALQDIFAIIMLAGVALAAWQRFVLKPKRFSGSNQRDAAIVLVLIATIVVAMEMEFAFVILDEHEAASAWRPLAGLIAAALARMGVPAGTIGETIFFWLHVCAILAFLIYIPGSKHLHMLAGFPNVFFRNLGPKGLLPEPPLELTLPEHGAPTSETLPATGTIRDLGWKGMLDLYSCTECGRCQAACPAYAAGLPLSPKLLIMDLRDHLAKSGADATPIAGTVIADETLWACTTCAACMEVCPLHIEHVPKIVGMRRSLVDDADVQPMLQDTLRSLQQYGNSFKKPARQRAKWAANLDFKIKDARKEPVDILWFVGDFAAYDARVQKLTRNVAELLHRAGVDFGILYEAEQNSGNDVRRVGDEGLFRTLAEHNIEQLAGCRFNRIMTTDPHTLNALAQDYPALGAQYEIVHYTRVLLDLLQAGRLSPGAIAPGTGVTYHDPCYLGRYNGSFDSPRQVIEQLGFSLQEMPRNRENSFCCGAGGGRIWMDDSASTERPSESRIKEALALGNTRYFVVSCPKDVVMYTAAVQALGVSDKIEVREISELFFL